MVGLIFDESVHYLDHLAPLCSVWNIPLVACDPHIRDLATRYYPNLQVHLQNLRTFVPPRWILSCTPRPLLQEFLFHPLQQTVWLPHGHSDKPPCFQVLQQESAALVYGAKMHRWIQEANPRLRIEQIGNFRKSYYLKHKHFYSRLVPRAAAAVFLYAPTWDDYEQSNTFWNCFPLLARALPDSDQLWVKLHPNTYRQFPEKIEQIKGKFGKPNIRWIEDFPPVYPILQAVDAYIGDASSIGYDFLSRNQPLFILSEKRTELSQVSLHVKPEKIFEAFRNPDPHIEGRKALYAKIFRTSPRLERAKQKLFADR